MKQFIESEYARLIFEYNNDFNNAINRLLHSNCNPAVETITYEGKTHTIEYDKKSDDDQWCTAWDEEKAMYCSVEELDTHLAGCRQVKDNWLLAEFERMLIDRLPDIVVKVKELSNNFEDCPDCGKYRSNRTHVCAFCVKERNNA